MIRNDMIQCSEIIVIPAHAFYNSIILTDDVHPSPRTYIAM